MNHTQPDVVDLCRNDPHHTHYIHILDIIFDGMVYFPGPVKADNLGDPINIIMHKLKLNRTPVERMIHVTHTHTLYTCLLYILFDGTVYLPGPVKTGNLGDN
jgi:hypothetical protein